jgi:short subunit dehydrogenase-like uncharacterized protein
MGKMDVEIPNPFIRVHHSLTYVRRSNRILNFVYQTQKSLL